jgi:hypothetical protein
MDDNKATRRLTGPSPSRLSIRSIAIARTRAVLVIHHQELPLRAGFYDDAFERTISAPASHGLLRDRARRYRRECDGVVAAAVAVIHRSDGVSVFPLPALRVFGVLVTGKKYFRVIETTAS